MIVRCQQCGTRYAVQDNLVGGTANRRVRCANCGRLWQYAADAVAIAASAETATATATVLSPAAASAPPAAPTALPPLLLSPQADTEPSLPSIGRPSLDGPSLDEPSLDREPRLRAETEPSHAAADPLTRPSVAAEPPATARRRTVWVAALGAAALAAGLVLAVILERDRIETLFPSTAAVYAMLHLDAPGAGLKVTVIPIRRADALVISGDIVNDASAPRAVPRLKLTLLDANKIDLVSKVIDPPVARLPPGAKAHFNTVFEHPANAAVRVDVTYAAD